MSSIVRLAVEAEALTLRARPGKRPRNREYVRISACMARSVRGSGSAFGPAAAPPSLTLLLGIESAPRWHHEEHIIGRLATELEAAPSSAIVVRERPASSNAWPLRHVAAPRPWAPPTLHRWNDDDAFGLVEEILRDAVGHAQNLFHEDRTV